MLQPAFFPHLDTVSTSAVADGYAVGSKKAAHPSATADGTDCIQVRIWFLEGKR
jgi:hypothetical protein